MKRYLWKVFIYCSSSNNDGQSILLNVRIECSEKSIRFNSIWLWWWWWLGGKWSYRMKIITRKSKQNEKYRIITHKKLARHFVIWSFLRSLLWSLSSFVRSLLILFIAWWMMVYVQKKIFHLFVSLDENKQSDEM